MKNNKYLLLATSLGTLLLLGWAAVEENFYQEWRLLQKQYRQALPDEQADAFEIRLRQVVVPELDITDRCVSCHVGMASGETGIAGDPVLGPHARVVHEPARFGCTVCHGGQGRATVKADAHGDVAHWPEPMIPVRFTYAGCGTCHTHLAVPDRVQLERGRALFERYDCLACHRMDGRGGTLRPDGGGMEGPDLSWIGATGIDRRWYEDHLERRDRAGQRAWRTSFGKIPTGEREAIEVFLSSRVAAPGLVESKASFHTLGCRGCHRVGGIGGDDGPDLTRVGQKDPGQIDFSNVRREPTLTGWFADHFRAPGRVVSDSQMPDLGLADSQIDELTFYMLSLRRSEVPEAFWPRDRIRAERFGEREFATDGTTLYGTFCASCHGLHGEGMRFPGMVAFPAIANPDFLSLAADEFIKATIRNGRPGRRMPAWVEREGGLKESDLDRIVAHLREMGGGITAAHDGRPRRWVQGDRGEGEQLYATNCAMCHGSQGEGGEGPALANRVLLATGTDTYLVETIRRGRRATSMPGFATPSPVRRTLNDVEIESIVAYIRQWEEQ